MALTAEELGPGERKKSVVHPQAVEGTAWGAGSGELPPSRPGTGMFQKWCPGLEGGGALQL